jgi:outer membrane protein W
LSVSIALLSVFDQAGRWVLTIAPTRQKQTVTIERSVLGGPTAIGTFKHLPPMLTLKYNILGFGYRF